MFTHIDHIGLAVTDLTAAVERYSTTSGLETVHREALPDHGVEVALFSLGETRVELMQPLGKDSPLARFLAKRGPGFHHVAYRVSDIEMTLADLRSKGVKLVNERPMPGMRESRVAFIHPSSTDGVLTEIVEPGVKQS